MHYELMNGDVFSGHYVPCRVLGGGVYHKAGGSIWGNNLTTHVTKWHQMDQSNCGITDNLTRSNCVSGIMKEY